MKWKSVVAPLILSLLILLVPAKTSANSIWQPTPSNPIHWQWQIGTDFNVTTDIIPNVTVYDIDMFDTSVSTVTALHAQGDIVIAYIDVGTAENYRPDYSSFPSVDLGNTNGWPGERYININDNTNIYPIIQSRIALAASKGFDAVEPDNIDAWENNSGFDITSQDQITYNEWIASTVHSYGMSVALKNDIEQAQTLEPYFDFDIDEQAYQYNEWSPGLLYFINDNKAVFEAEYGNSTPQADTMNSLHINSTTYDLNLVSPSSQGYVRIPCIPDDVNSWLDETTTPVITTTTTTTPIVATTSPTITTTITLPTTTIYSSHLRHYGRNKHYNLSNRNWWHNVWSSFRLWFK